MVALPDPHYTASNKAQSNFVLAIKLSAFLVLLPVLILGLDQMLASDWIEYGLKPRTPQGLWGVVTAPMLHASWAHLFSNVVPLMVGLTLMLYLYPSTSVRTLPAIYLGSGVLVWCFGRQAIHVGASGLVYGVLAFLFVSGLIRRDRRSLVVAMLIAFVYGSIFWGLLPYDASMSWELHLGGTLFGLIGAFIYRRRDRPPMQHFEWESEEQVDLDDE